MPRQLTQLAERDPVQRAVWRLYHARGVRGLALACIGFDLLVALATAVVGVGWASRYVSAPFSDWLSLVAIGGPIITVGVLVVAYLGRERYRSVLSWRGEGRTAARAPAVWTHAAGMSRELAIRLGAWELIGLFPVTLAVVILVLPLHDAFAVMLIGLVGGSSGLALIVFATELALRPLLEDISSYLPPDFEPPSQKSRLGLMMAVPLAAVALVSAVTVAAFADLIGNGPWRLALAVGIGVVTLIVGGVVFWVVMRSLRNPVEALLDATNRVRAGDLSTPVPIVTDDELGTVGSGFNRMLVELRRHERELRESRARVVAAADAARRKVERDLHDGAQQQLVLVGLKLGMLRRSLKSDTDAADRMAAELESDLARALRELRELAHGLYPQLLESEGLAGALREAASRSPIAAEVHSDGAGRYSAEVEAAVYFCCLEALQNAGKHAGPDARASITVTEDVSALRFEVTDDGRGFDMNGRPAGAGLENMADRVAALGGELRVRAQPDRGTTITGTIPLTVAEPATTRHVGASTATTS